MNATVPGSRIRPGLHVVQLAYATMTAQPGESDVDALRRIYGDDPASRALAALARGAVSPLTTGDPAWAGVVAGAAVADFFASLAPLSAMARLLTSGVRVDMTGRQSLTIPGRLGRPNAALGVVPEAGPIPVQSGTLGGVVLERVKVAGAVTLTAETARGPAGPALFEANLREDTSASLDAVALSTGPGGLLESATEVPAAAAGPDAMLADVENLAGAVLGAGGGVSVAFVAAPQTAFRLSLRLAEKNLTVWSSLGVPEGQLVALDPSAVALWLDPQPRFDTSTQALLHMEDAAPAAISTPGAPNVVAAPVRSLYQTDTIGLRMIAEAAWGLRAPAVAVIPDVAWA